MPSLNPGQNYDHLLTVVSGYDGMHDLMFHAAPEASADFRRGSVVSLNAAGELVAGLASLVSLALWAVNDVIDFDAASDIGNTSGGIVTTYPATGGYELKTTEVELTTSVAGDYAPNTLVTAAGAGDDLGKVTPVTLAGGGEAPLGTNVCGVVSKGVSSDVYGQDVLNFWPVYLPARA
jgi:hypothetical protein